VKIHVFPRVLMQAQECYIVLVMNLIICHRSCLCLSSLPRPRLIFDSRVSSAPVHSTETTRILKTNSALGTCFFLHISENMPGSTNKFVWFFLTILNVSDNKRLKKKEYT
jgi:hypothetical protein